MFISKGSYGYGESKNVFLSSVQKPHLPVRDCKRPRLMLASIGPRTEICKNLGLPLAIVPCLHESNVDIKRKLWVWEVQKCIPLVGVKSSLICAELQTTPSHVNQYRADNGNLRKSGCTFYHGTVLAPKQYLYQKKTTCMESPKMCSCSRCKKPHLPVRDYKRPRLK